MTSGDLWLLGSAAVLVVLAGVFSAADAAFSSFSRARAEEIVAEKKPGAKKLLAILDDPARCLNTTLMLRILCEVAAIVLVARLVSSNVSGWWASILIAIGAMLVVSFVVIGVAPRTLGRQHAITVALLCAGPIQAITRVLGPIPQLLILIGNALTPGKGYSDGPFSSETELRELVDMAEASSVIEDGERKMIHSVFELGDTTVREVMVPRPDVLFVERHKNLRQTMSLFLRSGYSRIPVVGENLDDVVGFAYLKDVTKRVFDNADAETTERIDQLLRPVHWVPDSKPADELLSEMQARRQHIAVVVDEYGGTSGIVTIEDVLEEIVGEITDEYDQGEIEIEVFEDGSTRVSSRYPVDDLDELFPGHVFVDDDVDSVGGLLAKELGRVPIPGSTIEAHGLRFEAEAPTGRRNRIGTVLISKVEPAPQSAEDDDYAEPHA
ncbi:HlyC/CorC family transporter [Nocardioides sp. JQ2195]|uniref:hemolysin family protein n=1 Tax=Nocardioides sp. JQ2195 TaxID=2592334 RepID=UPI00143E77BD|nr:hemolysin family protein [Nocardioides sp. JQ2195]QIX27350.1 HlyC/CorC family transporter [Nocardioides sp. JQ2195]